MKGVDAVVAAAAVENALRANARTTMRQPQPLVKLRKKAHRYAKQRNRGNHGANASIVIRARRSCHVRAAWTEKYPL